MGKDVRILILPPQGLLSKIMRPSTERRLMSFATVVKNEADRDLTGEEVAKILADFDGVITSWGSCRFTEQVLANANRLRIISHAAGSVRPIVSNAVWERDITVTNAADAISPSVAEMTLLFILASLRRLIPISNAMKNGAVWKREEDEHGEELSHKTIGLIGLGSVARHLIGLLKPYDLEILAYDPYISDEGAESLGVKKASLRDVLANSDVISIHAPAIPETYHMIGEKELQLIQDGAVLVNTARGSILDEKALIAELKRGRFVAALDVYEQEPLPLENELRKLPNVILTPHIAGLTVDSYYRTTELVVDDLFRFFNGEEPLHRVTRDMLETMA